jgi:hypothetical protein
MLNRLFITRGEHQRLLETIQRLEAAHRARADFESNDAVERIAVRVAEKLSRERAETLKAAALSADIGRAIEMFAAAMRRQLPPGVAGGRARARNAWRYSDGTFMPDGERAAAIEEFEIAEYERYATGGRARSHGARRHPDGTFAPS